MVLSASFVKKGRKEPNQNENILPSLLPTGFFYLAGETFRSL